MNDRKVYGLRIEVEPKCVTEDSESRVYMSLVPVKREYPNWGKLAERTFGKFKRFSKTAFKLFVSFTLAYGTAVAFFHLAYAERGYKAVGGEYLLVIGVFLFSYWIMGKVLE